MTSPKVPFADRVWAKVDTSGECWRWTASLDGKGYGQIKKPNTLQMLRAHRVTYELTVGPIPEGMELDHLCRNRWCVRPDHLEPVTRKENQRRGNSTPGLRSRQTHCQSGHAFDETNTYVTRRGHRVCRACRRKSTPQTAAPTQ